ncbi:glycosyltransferase family 4 protein [Thermodesulfobacteriota bacterium]
MTDSNISPNSQIFINGRFLKQRATGVQRYANEIFKRTQFSVVEPPYFFSTGFRGHLWEQVLLPFRLSSKHLLFSPCNTGPILIKNQVILIYDVAVLHNPDWFSRKSSFLYHLILPYLARRSKHIITISEFSKISILKYFNVSTKKISVVFPGVDIFFSPQNKSEIVRVGKAYNLPERYVLFVGSIDPRKNIIELIKAWKLIYRNISNVKLVVAGGKSNILGEVKFNSLADDVSFLGYVPDNDLPGLYSGAEIFIYPSLYEGFGLPPLEAMSCGCPVIVSNTSSLPEVCGDAALYCDPHSSDDIAEKIHFLINNTSLQEELKRKGRERALKFTWEKCAKEICEVIETLI